MEPDSILTAIKLLHTMIWLFFVGCIVAIPVAGLTRKFRRAGILSGLVWLECAVIGLNRGRCPLTDLAAHYTEARADNFDIFLPLWLATYNKAIFGTLFVLGELVVLWQWLRWRRESGKAVGASPGC
jgi:hypothetical protein